MNIQQLIQTGKDQWSAQHEAADYPATVIECDQPLNEVDCNPPLKLPHPKVEVPP